MRSSRCSICNLYLYLYLYCKTHPSRSYLQIPGQCQYGGPPDVVHAEHAESAHLTPLLSHAGGRLHCHLHL